MEKSRSRKSDIYRVEKLLKQRKVGRRIEYLVKWKNWSDINNTWEPEKNILDKRLIESFKRRLKRKDRREDTEGLSSPPCLTPVIRSPEHASNTTPSDPKYPLSLKLHAHAQVDSPSTNGLQHVSPCSPASYAQNLPEMDGKSGPCSSSTASSSEPPISPPPQTSCGHLSWETNTWLPERRFRQSTLLVAAASASAAHTAAAMAISRIATKQTSSTGQNLRHAATPEPLLPDQTVPQPPPLPPTPCVDERPKIRLTIPRERILPCPPPGVPSSSSSSGSRNSSQLTVSSSSLATEDENDQGSFASDIDQVASRFLAPTELPRRTNLTISSPPSSVLRTPGIAIDANISADTPSSPKWDCRGSESMNISTSLPKIIVHPPFLDQDNHRKRHQTNATTCNSPGSLHSEKLSSKRRRGVEKRSKHKRHRDQGCSQAVISSGHEESVPAYDILYPGTNPYGAVKIRRRSGSTASSLSSECCTPTTPTSSEEAPRLAPLRIQLPRSVANQLSSPTALSVPLEDRPVSARIGKHPTASVHRNCQLKEANNHNSVSLADSVARLLVPEPNRLRLMQEICVTDVTVGDLTISIKECSGPEHFFGVPSRQLVYWVPSTKSPHTFRQPRSTEETTEKSSPSTYAAANHFSQPPTATDENVAPTDSPTLAPEGCITNSLKPCELKTIYEEPTSYDASPSKPDLPISAQVPCTKLEPCDDAGVRPPTPLTGTLSLVPKSEPPPASSASSVCQSSLYTGEITASPENTRSPKPLTPPRRSSTPIHRSPASTDRSWNSNMLDTSIPVSPQTNRVFPSHLDASAEVSADSAAVAQPFISTLPSELHVDGDVTTSSWKLSRSKRTTPCRTKSTPCHRRNSVTNESSELPKRSVKSRSTAPSFSNRGSHRRPIKPAATSVATIPHPDDPAGVYTFPDSSPTHNLPLRSVAPRVSPNTFCKRSVKFLTGNNLMAKGMEHTSTSVVSLPSTVLSNGSCVAFSQTCSTVPSCTDSSTFISTYPPSSLGDVNCSNTETALALCLEQLQMHLLFPDPTNVGHQMSLTCPFSMSTTSSICATPLPVNSTWQPLLPTSLSPFLPTSFIPTNPSSLLPSFRVVPLSIPTTEPSISASLQLTDFMTASVPAPTVFDVGTTSAVFTSIPISDEAPIDLSAKR